MNALNTPRVNAPLTALERGLLSIAGASLEDLGGGGGSGEGLAGMGGRGGGMGLSAPLEEEEEENGGLLPMFAD